jgi:hypothetical protein
MGQDGNVIQVGNNQRNALFYIKKAYLKNLKHENVFGLAEDKSSCEVIFGR